MDKQAQQIAAFAFGIVFVCVLMTVAVFFPEPSPFQYLTFKTVLSLSAAGIAAMVPGFLHVSISGWIRAGGALAVFAIVYFYNPAQLVASPDRSPVAANDFGVIADRLGNVRAGLAELARLRLGSPVIPDDVARRDKEGLSTTDDDLKAVARLIRNSANPGKEQLLKEVQD